MGKKIARGFGYFMAALLFLLCGVMIALSAMFGSEGLVGAFGYNLYLCEESKFEGLNSGAAVIVEQCEPYDITEGNLILYSDADVGENVQPMLGYTESITMSDGVYSIGITDGSGVSDIVSESDFIGKAGWSSDFLGGAIRFSLSPFGVLIMAVLPCAAVIIFSLIKAYSDTKPLPEVKPQVKNSEDTEKPAEAGLTVKPDGKAEYGRPSGAKPARTADNVLFTYGKKNPVSKPAPASAPAAAQNRTATKPAPAASKAAVAENPSAAPAPTAARRPATKADIDMFDTRYHAATSELTKIKPASEESKPEPQSKATQKGSVPSSVATRRYLDSAVEPQRKTAVIPDRLTPDRTAELPTVTKKKNDAFFSQSGAPQIGRSNPKRNAVIDLEDALASAGRGGVVKSATGKTKRSDSRRSADILAAKNRDELIADEDDSADRSRYDIEDILAGLDRKK